LSEDLDFMIPTTDKGVDSNNKRISYASSLREKIKSLVTTMNWKLDADELHHRKAL
jgi:hypothetical protein